MKYARILLAVASELWAMEQEKLEAVIDFLRLQAAGEKFSAEDLQARITKGQEQSVARQEGAVAILPLRGVIANRMNLMSEISGGTSSEGFGLAFQAALRAEEVKAILIDVDSPGGMVSGTEELSDMIFAARGAKPIVAHVNARAASAAYWIASAADEIVVTKTGEVGSIGVLSAHQQIAGMLEKEGIVRTLISAGKYKAEGNELEPLGEEARAYYQARVDGAHEMFIKAVARNRNVAQTTVRESFGQGRMVDAADAVGRGMADRIATLDETLGRFGSSLYGAASTKRRTFAREREKRALALHD